MESIEWYRGLEINKKINLKSVFNLLTGVGWSEISFMLSLREKIDIAFNKLKIEGFEV